MKVVLNWVASDRELGIIRRHVPDSVEIVVPPAAPYSSRFVCDPADLAPLAQDADVLMGWGAIPDEILKSAWKLKLIAWLHAGCDQLNFPLLRTLGVKVCNVTVSNAIVVAEQAMALTLALAKRVLENHRSVAEGRPHSWWEPDFTSVSLHGKTMAIIGLGRIGELVAVRSKAFGMRVIGTKRDPSRHAGVADEVHPPEALNEVLSQADFVVLAAPLTDTTRRTIGEAALRAMKPSAFLVNIARGELVVEGALARALNEGWIAGFASDVWWNYADGMPPGYHFPLPSRLDIPRMKNVVASGDAAANLVEVLDSMIDHGSQSVGAFARGETPPRLVDMEQGY